MLQAILKRSYNFRVVILLIFFSFAAMKAYKPTDATTNPSLMLSAAGMKQYQHILDKAVKHGIESGT